MDSQVLFVEARGRGPAVLDRGWRTPDPSPTRDAASLPACTHKMLVTMPTAMNGFNDADADTPRGNAPPFGDGSEDVAFEDTPRGNAPPFGNFPTPSRKDLQRGEEFTNMCDMSIPMATQSSLAYAGWASTEYLRPYQENFEEAAVPVCAPRRPFEQKEEAEEEKLPQANPLPVGMVSMSGGYPHPPELKKKHTGQGDINTAVISLGSVGHPHSCGEACKYVWKQRGCKDGQNCTHCHLCTWNRTRARNGRK